MSTVVVKRRPRRPSPQLPSGDVVLDPPPQLPQPNARAWTNLLTALPMVAGSAAMAMMFSFQRSGPLGYIVGGMFGVSMLGMLFAQLANQSGQPGRAEMVAARRQYMHHLAQHRRRVLAVIDEQRQAMYHRHPHPELLWSTVASRRLWERRPTDGDFATVRVGLGKLEVATPIVPPRTTQVRDLEPICAVALRRFVKTYAVVDDLPIALSLTGFSRVYLPGDPSDTRAMIRATLIQAATFHAPDDLLIAVCAGPETSAEWEWGKWLPHTLHPTKRDALGALRMIAATVPTLEAIVEDLVADRPRFDPDTASVTTPHLVVVLDQGDVNGSDHLMTEGGLDGVTLLDLTVRPPRSLDRCSLILEITEDGTLTSVSSDDRSEVGRPDALAVEQALGVARQLAPLRLATASGENRISKDFGLAELLGLGDLRAFDPTGLWSVRPNRDRLRVPIGLSPDGTPVELDLKESAQDGMGPHGLLVGATGSGKSELLRTLVLALAATHSPETLNLILVDFKGGATFAKLDQLRHTSAVITNLRGQLILVDRMRDAISGELQRRQELLRAAGKYDSQRDYERARAAGAPLAPLPNLLIICDEFSELLTAKPDFIDMFVQIGRVGRSLGVHLLLASQILEEGRLRGLDNHLSYRIGLRTFSSMESRSVLGVPDAYELPRAPGHGYLKSGTEPLTRFRAAYVSGAYQHSEDSGAPVPLPLDTDPILPYSTHYVASHHPEPEPEPTAEPPEALNEGDSVLDILIDRLRGRGVPAHEVWLPPLDLSPTLDQLLPALAPTGGRGLMAGDPTLWGTLRIAVGVVDRPFDQRREDLVLDLSAGLGHVAVVGGPQSGKSVLLRTILTACALTHTPREVQFYCLDLGGGGLATLRDLPHVGAVGSRLDTERLRRVVAEVRQSLDARERLFAEYAVESMAEYRRRRSVGDFAAESHGDIFLVIDGLTAFQKEHEQLAAALLEIATRGLSLGIHLVVSANRWMDVRPTLRDLFGTKLELRLGDPTDSLMNRRAAMNVPEEAPGRGITSEGLHCLAALPRIDGYSDPGTVSEGVTDLVSRVAAQWDGPGAPAVRLLPTLLRLAELPAARGEDPARIPIGLIEDTLGPVFLDVDAEPHLMLFGDIECGKSGFLRALADAITQRYTPERARIVLVDYRRSLLGAVSPDHLLAYGTSATTTAPIVRDIVTAMRQRLPGPDITQEQLRERNWWQGPELFVIVDDYDLVSGSSNPLTPLVDLLAQGRDIGLHLMLVRRSGGAARALYDPMIARLRELTSPGVMMSGNRDEGVLLGNRRPEQLPPGRGYLVTRRLGTRLAQLAWEPPASG